MFASFSSTGVTNFQYQKEKLLLADETYGITLVLYQRNTLPVPFFPVLNKGDQLYMLSYLSSHLRSTVKYDVGQLASCQRLR